MAIIPAQPVPARTIHLEWDQGSAVMSSEDARRFTDECQWAADAHLQQPIFEEFLRRLKSEFLPEVRRWCADHADRVIAAYVPIHTDHLQVFVVRREPRYDFPLGDDLSNLEMDLFDRSWSCEIIQVPGGSNESLRIFFDPESSVQVY